MIAFSFLIGSRALSETWWLRCADPNVKNGAANWTSPLISLKECEATRRKLANLMYDPDSDNTMSQFVCLEGKQ